MKHVLLCPLLLTGISLAQSPELLPDKVQALKSHYDAAVERATAPLTATYVEQLRKIKDEYTQSGNAPAALATENLLKELTTRTKPGQAVSSLDVPLSKMSLEQFKHWLTGVTISEQTTYKNRYSYDGNQFTSLKPGASGPRVHLDTIIEVGQIFVPFTSTNAKIKVDASLTKARVTYSTGETIEAVITPKAKK